MTIRPKFLITTALMILLPFAAVAYLMIHRPIQRFTNSSDGEIKAAVIAAGEAYQNQEDRVREGALYAAQQIGTTAIFEMLQTMRPIPGAASGSGAASPPSQAEKDLPKNRLNALLATLQPKYNIDFLILLDINGKILIPYNPPTALDEMIRNDVLVKSLLNDSASGNLPRSSSAERSRVMLQPLVQDRGKIDQQDGSTRVENGLVIEAVAPIFRVGSAHDLLGAVLAGHLVNDSKIIVDDAKSRLDSLHGKRMDVSIVFNGLTVATTVDNVAPKHGLLMDAAVSRATSSSVSVHSINVGGEHVLAGVYPITNATKAVIGQLVVTEPQDPARDALMAIGWIAIFGIAASFIFTMIALFILTSRLSAAMRKVNTDIIRVGLGDFDEAVDVLTRRDEAGDLSESTERLRVTVKQAVERLRRRGTSQE